MKGFIICVLMTVAAGFATVEISKHSPKQDYKPPYHNYHQDEVWNLKRPENEKDRITPIDSTKFVR